MALALVFLSQGRCASAAWTSCKAHVPGRARQLSFPRPGLFSTFHVRIAWAAFENKTLFSRPHPEQLNQKFWGCCLGSDIKRKVQAILLCGQNPGPPLLTLGTKSLIPALLGQRPTGVFTRPGWGVHLEKERESSFEYLLYVNTELGT